MKTLCGFELGPERPGPNLFAVVLAPSGSVALPKLLREFIDSIPAPWEVVAAHLEVGEVEGGRPQVLICRRINDGNPVDRLVEAAVTSDLGFGPVYLKGLTIQ